MRIEWMEQYLAEAEKLVYSNQINEGIDLLKNLLYDEPGYASLHNHLGWAYLYYTADLSAAELHLKMAIRFDEAFAPPYLHLGNLYMKKAAYKNALFYLEKGLVKEQANKVALYECMGRAYEQMHGYAKAIKAYKQAALASMTTFEIDSFKEGIRRCRKKRLIFLFSL